LYFGTIVPEIRGRIIDNKQLAGKFLERSFQLRVFSPISAGFRQPCLISFSHTAPGRRPGDGTVDSAQG
jgi:hypothetical protein